MELNKVWEQRIIKSGAEFVYFVDISALPSDIIGEYHCAVLFGKTLSKEYLSALRANEPPKSKEVFNTERRMDALSKKIAEQLEEEGYKSIGKLKFGLLPHKTVALKAGLGFIGKNNLLVTQQYGCALMLGKVLTTAPFYTECENIKEPQCGECNICVEACEARALLGKEWSVGVTRNEIMVRKLCTLCLKCMVWCPFTAKYIR